MKLQRKEGQDFFFRGEESVKKKNFFRIGTAGCAKLNTDSNQVGEGKNKTLEELQSSKLSKSVFNKGRDFCSLQCPTMSYMS